MAVTPNLKIFTDIGELLTLEGVRRKDGRHVTEADLGRIPKAAVVVSKGKIVWAGPQKNLPREFRSGRRVSCKSQTVLPGFVECHTHLVFAGSRAKEFESRLRGLSYQEISKQGGGIKSTTAATRKAPVQELLKRAQTRLDSFRRQGVTTLEAKSGYGLDQKTELKILEVHQKLRGARIVSTYLGPHAIPEGRSKAAYLEEILSKTLPLVRRKNLATRVDMFVEEGFFSVDDARHYAQRAHELGFDVCFHADQLTRTGASVAAVELSARSAEHMIQLTETDIAAFAGSALTAVLLPAADLYMKMAYPPARKLIDAGARVALATDFNPGSSPTVDINFVGVLARLEMKMTLPEVIAAYTYNAASALRLQDHVGAVEAGLQADLIAVEGDWTDLFYSVGAGPSIRVL